MKDYYLILGLSPNCTDTEIRKQYRKLAMKYHPDRNINNRAAEEKFKEIAEAYAILIDSKKRQKLDILQRAQSSAVKENSRKATTTQKKERSPWNAADTLQSWQRKLYNSLSQQNFLKAVPELLKKTPLKKECTRLRFFAQNAFLQSKTTLRHKLQQILAKKDSLSHKIRQRKQFRKKGKGTRFHQTRESKHGKRARARNSYQYKRGELDLVYQTPLTKTELKRGKKICVRVFNNSKQSGYEFFKIIIPPGSKNGQKICIKGKGHESSLDNNTRGDLYLHLEEKP